MSADATSDPGRAVAPVAALPVPPAGGGDSPPVGSPRLPGSPLGAWLWRPFGRLLDRLGDWLAGPETRTVEFEDPR